MKIPEINSLLIELRDKKKKLSKLELALKDGLESALSEETGDNSSKENKS
jgi:hypothetical protein